MMFRHWFDFLFPPRSDEEVLRGVSDDAFFAELAPQSIGETSPETAALLPFHRAPVRAAIHEAKYHGNERAFALLASVLAEYLRDADDVGRTTSNIRLVPVPLGKKRRKERGFNQTEEIAYRAARELGITVDAGLLVRTRETVSQVSLPRPKRIENMRGAFTASLKLRSASRAEVSEYTYIVVDDVVTTGATLQAAIDALRDAGAQHIVPLALAH